MNKKTLKMNVYDIIDNMHLFDNNFENTWNELNNIYKNGDGIEKFIVYRIKHELAKKYMLNKSVSPEIKEELKDYL
jgi:hypothetical protein